MVAGYPVFMKGNVPWAWNHSTFSVQFFIISAKPFSLLGLVFDFKTTYVAFRPT